MRRSLPLVAAGDLYDSQDPSPADVAFVHRQMDRMEAAGLPVYFIQGQHERDAHQPWMATHLWPTHVHGRSFQIGPVKLYGLDYQPPGRLEAALNLIPEGTDVLVCHQVWGDLMGSIAEIEGFFHQVPHVRAILTGDYHKHLAYPFVRLDGTEGVAYSPGSLAMQPIDEPEQEGYFRFNESLLATRMDLPGRLVRRYTVRTAAELDDLLENQVAFLDEAAVIAAAGLPPHLSKPLVQVSVAAELEGAHARLAGAFAGLYHLFPKRLAARESVAADDPAQQAMRALAQGGLLGAVALATAAGPVRDGVIRLLKAADPAGELELIRAEFDL